MENIFWNNIESSTIATIQWPSMKNVRMQFFMKKCHCFSANWLTHCSNRLQMKPIQNFKNFVAIIGYRVWLTGYNWIVFQINRVFMYATCHTPKFVLSILISFDSWLMIHLHTLTIFIHCRIIHLHLDLHVTSLIQRIYGFLLVIYDTIYSRDFYGLGFPFVLLGFIGHLLGFAWKRSSCVQLTFGQSQLLETDFWFGSFWGLSYLSYLGCIFEKEEEIKDIFTRVDFRSTKSTTEGWPFVD